jgi:hypothetical protein
VDARLQLQVAITDPGQWSNVNGQFGNQDLTTLAGYQDVINNLGNVGMTFGGGCFLGHAVEIEAQPADSRCRPSASTVLARPECAPTI